MYSGVFEGEFNPDRVSEILKVFTSDAGAMGKPDRCQPTFQLFRSRRVEI